MDPVLQNILALIGTKNGAQRKFTNDLGFCPSTVGDWKSGKSRSYTKHLPKIAAYFGVTVDSLLVSKQADENIYPADRRHKVPVLGTIRAGFPIIAEEHLQGYDYADVADPDGYFYLRVKGDSMIGAGITDGSLVLIRRQDYAENGQIVACMVEGDSATLKRYRVQNDTILLLPENPSYKPFILSEKDFSTGEAAILGVAIEVKKKLI